jgi:hypothetical protein
LVAGCARDRSGNTFCPPEAGKKIGADSPVSGRGEPEVRCGRKCALKIPEYGVIYKAPEKSTNPPQAAGYGCSYKVSDSGSIPLVPPQGSPAQAGSWVWTLRNESREPESGLTEKCGKAWASKVSQYGIIYKAPPGVKRIKIPEGFLIIL